MNKYPLYGLLFLWVIGNAATFAPPPGHIVSAGEPELGSCFLEQPTGITTTVVTPTSITLQWNPVQGAGYFRVKVYDKVNKDFVRNYLVPAKPGINTTTAGNLIAGVSYHVYILSVCANGQESL